MKRCKECQNIIVEDKPEEVVGFPHGDKDYYCYCTKKELMPSEVETRSPAWCPYKGIRKDR